MLISDANLVLANWSLWVYGIPRNYRPDDGGKSGHRSGLTLEGQCWLRVVGQKDYSLFEERLRSRYGRFESFHDPDLDAWISQLAADLLQVPLSISTGDELDDTPPPKWRRSK